MQLLGRRSEESNGVELLGIIEEDVPKMADHGLPLPHMGWNRVYAKAGDRLFRGIEDGAYFYVEVSAILNAAKQSVTRFRINAVPAHMWQW